MTLAFVTVVILLGQAAPQAAAPAAQPAINCFAQTDPAVMAFCEGQDAARGSGKAAAAAAFRRAADLTRDSALKKRALEQLESLYGPDHLNQPYAIDPILRELMALSHGDLAPMFRLAKLQESQGQFDAAESTLLGARQQKPDDPAPWRELGEYFTRRATAMAAAEKEKKQNPDTPDRDGVYALGGSVQAPEKISTENVAMPLEVTAGGLSGDVTIMAVIDAVGRVRDAKILQSVRGLDDTALAAVRQWRFAPAMLNGQPVPVRMPVVVRFGG
jgi:TonB family protein